jgi:hypothetical protein
MKWMLHKKMHTYLCEIRKPEQSPSFWIAPLLLRTTKAKQSRYTPWWRMEERKYSSYSFLTSALGGVSGQRHAQAALCPGERTPITHCTGGWVGLRAGLNTGSRKNPLPLPGIEPR